MKRLSAILVLLLAAFTVKAQPNMSITFGIFALPNGGSFTSPIAIPEGTEYTFDFTVKNSGDQNLTLSESGGHYVVLTGNAAPYVTLVESDIESNPVVAPAGNVGFSVTALSSMPPGSYSLVLTMANDDPNKNPYTGTVNFSISAATGVVSAREAGIVLSPSPSTDGRMTITSEVTVHKIVVYGSNGVSEEFGEGKSFHTRQKGLLIVKLYTDKGIVQDRILVQ